jgi:hypothetical protein
LIHADEGLASKDVEAFFFARDPCSTGAVVPTTNGDLLRIVDRSRIAPQAV